jgi:hypothetical protein
VENSRSDIGASLGHELSQAIDRDDAAGERIQVPLRFGELARETLVKAAMIGQVTELVMVRRIPELVSSKLHVIVCSLDSQHVFETLYEGLVFERLREVVVRSGAQDTAAHIGCWRQKNDRDEAIVRDGLDYLAGIDPVQPRHVEIEHDQIDRLSSNRVNSLLATACSNHHQAARTK